MRGRVPALIKLKYQLMAESPFGYFRGAVPVMAADLAVLPNTGIVSQLCGDAHVRNLGAFAAPDGRLVFDINDFDETIRGPFEWDLKRMAASLVLAGRASGHKDASARQAVEECIARYAAQMRAFASMPHLEVGRFQVHRLGQVAPVHEALLKAERATPQHTLEQLTEPVSGKVRRAAPLQRIEAHADPRHRRAGRRRAGLARALSRNAGAAAAASALVLSPRRRGLQSGRHRLGGPARLLHLLRRQRPRRSALSADQGGAGLRPTRLICPTRTPPHHNGQRVAEGQTRHAGADPIHSSAGRTSAAANISSASSTTTRAPSRLKTWPAAASRPTPKSAANCWPAATPAPATRSVIAGYIGSGDGFAEALAKFGVAYADQTEKDWEELRRSGKAKAKS